jgi:hypothetical protein
MDGLASKESDAVGVTESETLSDGVDDGVTEGVGVGVDEGVGVSELEGVDSAEPLPVWERLPVLDGDAPIESEVVAVTLRVDVGDDEVVNVVFAV